MGLKQKEDRWFNNGMVMALSLAETGGIDLLRTEVRRRVNMKTPAGVMSCAHRTATREECKAELTLVAISMAYATKQMKLPPSVISDFLKLFNKNIDNFNESKEAFDLAVKELNSDSAVLEQLKEFNKKMGGLIDGKRD